MMEIPTTGNGTTTTTTTATDALPPPSVFPSSSYQYDVFDIGHAREFYITELQNIHPLIAHKQHELSVYISARQLIETRVCDERCMVFLTDNIFVQTTREQALGILQRQINFFQNNLHHLEEERNALEQKIRVMDQFQINEDGLVEIRETADEHEYPLKNKAEKRIAHVPKNQVALDKNRAEQQIEKNIPQRPKGISDADYEKFIELVKSHNLSDDDEDDTQIDFADEEEETTTGKQQNGTVPPIKHENGCGGKATKTTPNHKKRTTLVEDKRHVHFSERIHVKSFDEQEQQWTVRRGKTTANRKRRPTIKNQNNLRTNHCSSPSNLLPQKSILKNRSEQSPIDADQVQKMEVRDVKRLVSVSTETFGDNVVEAKPDPVRKLRSMTNKRQKDKNRPISRWKAERMNLPISDEEQN